MLSSVKLLWSVEKLGRRESHIFNALKVGGINLVLKDANETSELLRITLLTSFFG